MAYAAGAFGITAWPRQAELLRLVAAHPRTAVRAGHKVSKTLSAVLLALWWCARYADSRVIVTAPTNNQIRNIFWKELRRIVHRASVPLPSPAQLPALGMQWPDGREIIGFSTKEPERMAGLSGAHMLFIVDEASGVEEDIFEAIEGNRAGGAHLLLMGNPTQPAGTFFDAFHQKSGFYKTMHISSVEAALAIPHPAGLATLDWVDEKLAEWGVNDPRYAVRVLGDFAESAEAAVIPLSVVIASQQRHEDMATPTSQLEVGCDPAKFGDDKTAIIGRRGNKIIDIVIASKLDENAVALLVRDFVNRHLAPGEPPALVKVDSTGLGQGVLVAMGHLSDRRFTHHGIDASSQANDVDKYFNKRTELWFGLADWLKSGGAVPSLPTDLEAELLSARYSYDNRGRLKVERKDETKKRLGRSPDLADALALCVHRPRLRLAVNPTARHDVPTYRWANAGRGY